MSKRMGWEGAYDSSVLHAARASPVLLEVWVSPICWVERADMAKYGVIWCENQARTSEGRWSDWMVGRVMSGLQNMMTKMTGGLGAVLT